MALPDRYPPARWEPVDYIDEAGPLQDPPRGWVLHVVVGDGDPLGTFQHAHRPNRRFAHLWVAKDGHVAQYQHLNRASWAQAAGNMGWWSVETEGDPDEPLTDAQLDALAAWHVWCGAVDALAGDPDRRGIGTHAMGGADWGGHECPGRVRAAQRIEIIRRAQLIRVGGEDMPSVEDYANASQQAIWHAAWPTSAGGTELAQDRLLQAARGTNVLPAIAALQQKVDDLTNAVAGLAHEPPVTLDQNQLLALAGIVAQHLSPTIADQVATVLAQRLGNG